MFYLFFAGWRDDLAESNTNSLPLITFVTIQASLQDWYNLRQYSLTQFTHKVTQCTSCHLKNAINISRHISTANPGSSVELFFIADSTKNLKADTTANITLSSNRHLKHRFVC